MKVGQHLGTAPHLAILLRLLERDVVGDEICRPAGFGHSAEELLVYGSWSEIVAKQRIKMEAIRSGEIGRVNCRGYGVSSVGNGCSIAHALGRPLSGVKAISFLLNGDMLC